MRLSCKRFMMVVMILSVLSLGCTPQNDINQKIRIAHFPNATHAQAILMRHLGLLEKYLDDDVEIEFVVFNAGSSEIEAFFSQHVDIGYIGPIPAINGNIKSNGEIIIVSGSAIAGATLVANVSSEINSILDLGDKRVALPQYGNTQHIALLNLLKLQDLKDSSRGGSVELVFTPNSQLRVLFEKNEVDAAFVPEPWASELITSGLGKPVYEKSMPENNATTVVITDKLFLQNQRDLVDAFLKAHIDATDYIVNYPDEAKKIILDELLLITNHSLSKESIDEAFQNIIFGTNPPIESVELHMSWFYEAGFIDDVVSVQELFDLELYEELKPKN